MLINRYNNNIVYKDILFNYSKKNYYSSLCCISILVFCYFIVPRHYNKQITAVGIPMLNLNKIIKFCIIWKMILIKKSRTFISIERYFKIIYNTISNIIG